MNTKDFENNTITHAISQPNTGWFSWLGYFFAPTKQQGNVNNGNSDSNGNNNNNSSSNSNNDNDNNNLMEDWEWMLSKTEEFLLKQSQNEVTKTVSELDAIRNGTSTSFKVKPRFLKAATEAILALKSEERVDLQMPLDSSKRSKVITDTVRHFSDEWLVWIRARFFTPNANLQGEKWNKFVISYGEQTYSKNTVGMLREVGFQASHGLDGTLSARVLCDITWSIWNALRGSIRGVLERELSQEELYGLADEVTKMQEYLIQLWTSTIKMSRGGVMREGKLVTAWREEEKVERQRIFNIKNKGLIDGKYEEGPIQVHDWERKHIDEVNQIKKALSLSLQNCNNTHTAPILFPKKK